MSTGNPDDPSSRKRYRGFVQTHKLLNTDKKEDDVGKFIGQNRALWTEINAKVSVAMSDMGVDDCPELTLVARQLMQAKDLCGHAILAAHATVGGKSFVDVDEIDFVQDAAGKWGAKAAAKKDSSADK